MANQPKEININPSNVKTILLIVGGLLFLLIFWGRLFITIGSGEGGVLYKTFSGGVDTEYTYGEGFQVIAPWNKMHVYDLRQKELLETMKVLSSNGLDIEIEASTWYRPQESQLGLLHKNIGEDYLDKVVRPAIRSAARSVIGRYTPEQIYSTKRDAIQNEIYIETSKILKDKYVLLENVLVRDVTLPATIKDAIERKLKQEQESLEYEFRLQKAEKEAERVQLEASGKAKANQILNASLSDNILKDKGIEATTRLSESKNSKIIVIGNSDGLPLILGNN